MHTSTYQVSPNFTFMHLLFAIPSFYYILLSQQLSLPLFFFLSRFLFTWYITLSYTNLSYHSFIESLSAILPHPLTNSLLLYVIPSLYLSLHSSHSFAHLFTTLTNFLAYSLLPSFTHLSSSLPPYLSSSLPSSLLLLQKSKFIFCARTLTHTGPSRRFAWPPAEQSHSWFGI